MLKSAISLETHTFLNEVRNCSKKRKMLYQTRRQNNKQKIYNIVNKRLQRQCIFIFHSKIFFLLLIFLLCLFLIFHYFIFSGEIDIGQLMFATKMSTANMLMAKIPDTSINTGTKPTRKRILALS